MGNPLVWIVPIDLCEDGLEPNIRNNSFVILHCVPEVIL